MSIPMNNINQGGYNPYAGGYPPPIQNQPQPGFNPNVAAGYPQPYVPPGYPQPGYPDPHSMQAGGMYPPSAPQPGFHQPGIGYGGNPPGYQPVSQGQVPMYPSPGPIAAQPGTDPNGWMIMPTGVPNCPPGLEYLTTVDQLLVKQKVELLEAFIGFETSNKYTIKNSLGQKVFWAVEENDCCTRNCCGPSRPFEMKILDIYKNQVMHLSRPLACSSCCFPCCLQKMEVSSPPGNVIGTIEQEWSICYPQFSLKNHAGDTVLRIEGPVCTFTICGDVEFKDFMFFEKSQNQENDRPGML